MGAGSAAGTKRVRRRKSGGGAVTLAPLPVCPCFERAWKMLRVTDVSNAPKSFAWVSMFPAMRMSDSLKSAAFTCRRGLGLLLTRNYP
jgi:hypothetical protein